MQLKIGVIAMTNYLTIPFAIHKSSRQIVAIAKANINAPKGTYECCVNNCKAQLNVVKSKYGRPFFKHYPNSKSNKHCSSKSQDRHTKAKLLIRDSIKNAIDHRAPMPILIFQTPNREHEVHPFFAHANVLCEYKINNRRIDVAVLDSLGNPLLLIEVKDKHAIDPIKEIDLQNFWWIEVNAKEVLTYPGRLIIHRHKNFSAEYELGYQQSLFT